MTLLDYQIFKRQCDKYCVGESLGDTSCSTTESGWVFLGKLDLFDETIVDVGQMRTTADIVCYSGVICASRREKMSDRHDRAANPEGSTGCQCQCHHLADCVTLSAATSHWRPTHVNRPTSMLDRSTFSIALALEVTHLVLGEGVCR